MDCRIAWPNEMRVAVLVSVLLENWSNDKSPSYFPRTTALKPGAVDRPAQQWSQFGAEEGIWRIIQILDRSGIRATVFSNAVSAEMFPDLIRRITDSGHDIAAHGYSQDQFLLDMTVDQQQATIRTCLDILEKQSGRRPEGWCTPVYGWTAHTPELLVKEGLKWHSDALNTSLPRRQTTASGSIVALPWSDFVDNRVLRLSPRNFYDVYVDTFEYLYSQERLGLLHIGFHGHFGGRPLMSAMLFKLLRHLTSFSHVWFVTHAELVGWFLDQRVDEIPSAQRFTG